MKSIHKALHCPCGCDMPVHPKVDAVYAFLKRHYGTGFKLTQGVACNGALSDTADDVAIPRDNQIMFRVSCYRTPTEKLHQLNGILSTQFKSYHLLILKRDIVLTMGTGGQVAEYGKGV